MSIAESSSRPHPRAGTFADVIHELGDIPLDRILADPAPGTATEADLLRYLDEDNLGCELAHGVLVVKTMGLKESVLAGILGTWINTYLDKHPLGACAGEHGICRLLPGVVRAPDVSFISRAQLARVKDKDFTFAPCAPELCVEVWSKGNTRREIDRKIEEYFQNGAKLVWEIFPRKRTAAIYHSPTDMTPVTAADTVDGEDVLPGFQFLLEDLFALTASRLQGLPNDAEDDDEPSP